jgi:hypothetical protein
LQPLPFTEIILVCKRNDTLFKIGWGQFASASAKKIVAIVVILADSILYFILIIVNRCIRTRILSGFGGISADIGAKSRFLFTRWRLSSKGYLVP